MHKSNNVSANYLTNVILLRYSSLQGYGMTEVGSAHMASADMDVNLESPGKALPGTRTKIDKPNEYGVGEVRAPYSISGCSLNGKGCVVRLCGQ